MKKKYTSNNISYKGKVSIQLMRDKKLLGKKVYYNNGNLPLFQFLAYCTEGRYAEVESLRPKFIKIFKIGNSGDPIPPFDNFNDLIDNSAELKSLTFPLYSGEPLITSNNDGKYGKCSVKFKFIIPFTQLSSFEDLNMISLYSQKYVNDDSNHNASAFIIIEDKNNPGYLSNIVDESGLDTADYNLYNLFIEWTMTFKNEGE